MMKKLSRNDAVLLLGFCVAFAYYSMDSLPIDGQSTSSPSSPFESRRSLQAGERDPGRRNGRARELREQRRRRNREEKRRRAAETTVTNTETTSSTIYPWAENHLQPLTTAPNPSTETVLFWHIPKSGGTTAKSIYECFDVTIASRAGSLLRFGHSYDSELLAIRPWGVRGPAYVNVDTTGKKGINRAAQMGLVPSGLAGVIFTSDPAYAIEHLYDVEHKGRVVALFRHPVDRLVSKFYYLQIATWERKYRPEWKDVSLYEFANRINNDNNHYVKKLAGKRMNDVVNENDLQLAMATIKERFIVGLMEKMEESFHRFNAVMGIDENEEKKRICMDKFFGHAVKKKSNSNSHPTLTESDGAWQVLAEKNEFDMRLYEFILQLFDEQKEIIDSYATTPAGVEEEGQPLQEDALVGESGIDLVGLMG